MEIAGSQEVTEFGLKYSVLGFLAVRQLDGA
jgi:hypothetical protein